MGSCTSIQSETVTRMSTQLCLWTITGTYLCRTYSSGRCLREAIASRRTGVHPHLCPARQLFTNTCRHQCVCSLEQRGKSTARQGTDRRGSSVAVPTPCPSGLRDEDLHGAQDRRAADGAKVTSGAVERDDFTRASDAHACMTTRHQQHALVT